MKPKAIWQSKTFWFNLVTGLTIFLALPELTAVLPDGSLPYVGLGIAGLNIILRYVTTGPVSLTGQ